MVYFVWALVGVLAFVKKDSKTATLVVAAFIACIFCFNTANADLGNYQAQYAGIASGAEIGGAADEPLYLLANHFFASLGFSYEVFRAVQTFVGLFCVVSTLFRFSPYPAWTLYLYSIYPLSLDVTQLRFFVGYAIVFFSLRFLLDYQRRRNKKNVFLFFTFLLLATGFHYACALYAILGLLFFDVRKHRTLFFLLIPACILASSLLLNLLMPVASMVIGAHKADIWVGIERTTSLRNILRVLITRPVLLVYSLFLSLVIRERRYAHFVGGNKNSLGVTVTHPPLPLLTRPDKKRYYDLRVNESLFLGMLYVVLFFLLELTVSAQYERLSRLGLLIGVVLLSRQIFYVSSFNKAVSQILLATIYAAYFVSVMFLHQVAGLGYYIDYVFRQVMESNSLFGITY